MLQLNHVTVTRGEREVLSDCTFQFKEGDVYIIVSEDPDDYKAFLKCVCKEKATKRGEIVTWDGSVIYNSLDDMFLPRFLTIKEYLDNLVEVSGNLTTTGALIKRLGLDDKDSDMLIGQAPEHTKAVLRLAPVYATQPYIVVFGEPFPETDVLCRIINDLKEEKIFIIAASDISTAKEISSGTDGKVFLQDSGDFKSLSIGDI